MLKDTYERQVAVLGAEHPQTKSVGFRVVQTLKCTVAVSQRQEHLINAVDVSGCDSPNPLHSHPLSSGSDLFGCVF